MDYVLTWIEKLRHFAAKYRRFFLIAIILVGILLAFLYGRAFFRVGMEWNGAFLFRSSEGNTVTYSGKDAWSEIEISVVSVSENYYSISYYFPEYCSKTYLVSISEEENFWRDVTIDTQDLMRIYAGRYQKGNRFLYDYNQQPEYGELDMTPSNVNPYQDFYPNYRLLIGTTLGEYDRLYGNGWYLLAGLLLAAVAVLDVKYSILTVGLRRLLVGKQDKQFEWLPVLTNCLWVVLVLVAFGFLMAAI